MISQESVEQLRKAHYEAARQMHLAEGCVNVAGSVKDPSVNLFRAAEKYRRAAEGLATLAAVCRQAADQSPFPAHD